MNGALHSGCFYKSFNYGLCNSKRETAFLPCLNGYGLDTLECTRQKLKAPLIILNKSMDSHKYQTNAALNTQDYFCGQNAMFCLHGKNVSVGINQFHQEGMDGREKMLPAALQMTHFLRREPRLHPKTPPAH